MPVTLHTLSQPLATAAETRDFALILPQGAGAEGQRWQVTAQRGGCPSAQEKWPKSTLPLSNGVLSDPLNVEVNLAHTRGTKSLCKQVEHNRSLTQSNSRF